MFALQFSRHGGPDVLEHIELATPQIDADHALVRVHAASINPSDVKNLSGHFDHTRLPRIPGRDFSGVVEQGPAEWIGADIWGTGGDIGFTRDGTHAQYIVLPVQALCRKPRTLDHAQASAVGVNFVVAWLGTMEFAQLRAGETIAILGAGGGVGGAVAQIAKAQGARVIGIDRQPLPEHLPAAGKIDDFVLFGDDTAQQLRALPGLSDGVDVVFDSVGGIAFETALKLAKRRGRVVEISATGKRRVEFDLIDFYHNETQLLGADSAKLGVAESAPLMRSIAAGFDAGHYIAPAIAERIPLADGQRAYALVAQGTHGRVVLIP